MAVAGAGDTDTGREIEVSATVGVVEVAALAVVDGDRGGLLQDRGQFGHGGASRDGRCGGPDRRVCEIVK